MPGRCNCPGQACGCSVQAGAGINVEGTGTTKSPFTISLDSGAAEISQSAAGGLDLSAYNGDSVVTVDLLQNVTGMTLPNRPGARIELMLLQSVGGKTVTWPAGIRWTGGAAPAVTTTVGKATWVALRQAAGFWVGTSYGVV